MFGSSRMVRSLVTMQLVLVASVAVSTTAMAQASEASQAQVSTAHGREGLWFNVGLGAGSMGVGCDGCSSDRTNGLSGGLAIGTTLSPRFLVGAQTAGWVKSEDGVTMNVSSLNAMVRFYPTAGRFFLTGGLGFGRTGISAGGESASDTGASAILGLGYDFRMTNSVSLTPFFNSYAVANDGGNANVGQFGIGVTFH